MTSSFIHFFHGPASSFSSCFCFWANCFLVRGLATVSEELLELLLSELFLVWEYSEPARSRAAAEMPTVGYARKAGGNFIESMTSIGAGVLLQSKVRVPRPSTPVTRLGRIWFLSSHASGRLWVSVETDPEMKW